MGPVLDDRAQYYVIVLPVGTRFTTTGLRPLSLFLPRRILFFFSFTIFLCPALSLLSTYFCVAPSFLPNIPFTSLSSRTRSIFSSFVIILCRPDDVAEISSRMKLSNCLPTLWYSLKNSYETQFLVGTRGNFA